MEQWRAVPGFDGYEVSDVGNVRSYWRKMGPQRGNVCVLSDKPKLLKPGKRSKARAYLCVTLYRAGKQITQAIHELVALAFYGPKPAGLHVCHENDVGNDNRLSNLYYGTPKKNYQDRVRNGKSLQGEGNPRAVLRESQVVEIRRRAGTGETFSSIAKAFGIKNHVVRQIHHRITWKHLGG